MRKPFVLVMLILACALTGCGHSYHWTQSHPDYRQVPYGDLAIAGTENAFVLTRAAWFAKKLEISTDSVQLKVTSFCEQVFLEEFKRAYPSFTRIPKEIHKAFPEESQKLDDRIFLKGHIPEQGVVVKDSEGKIPPRILILHEFFIGTDLKRELFFDYALIHNESADKKTSKNLSAVISYTLWDNEKQRPLFSAVDEVQKSIITPTMADMESLIRTSVQQIRKNMYAGVVR